MTTLFNTTLHDRWSVSTSSSKSSRSSTNRSSTIAGSCSWHLLQAAGSWDNCCNGYPAVALAELWTRYHATSPDRVTLLLVYFLFSLCYKLWLVLFIVQSFSLTPQLAGIMEYVVSPSYVPTIINKFNFNVKLVT